MEKTLVINSGSSTLKFKLFEMPQEKCLAQGCLECIGLEVSKVKIKYDGKVFKEEKQLSNHAMAIEELLKLLKQLEIVTNFDEITGIGHRVVAGGEYYSQPVVIDNEVINNIDKLAEIAPLHNPNNLIGIKEFKKVLPNAVSVAVFDTAFHQTIPEKNYLYSTPYEWYEKYGVRRYGYHGTSHRYVSQKAAEYFEKPLADLKLVTCHLGAGASLCAIRKGKSYDTSMGFTPLAGLTMASRSGDLDPSIIEYVMKKENISDINEIITILNKKSGLLGISGVSSDMRDVMKASEKGNSRAKLSLEIFVKNVVRYIGQYMFEMGGLDGIIFTAGIGENSDTIRKMVISQLKFLNVKLDENKNIKNAEGILSTPDSAVKVLKISTNEELMIARDVENLKKLH